MSIDVIWRPSPNFSNRKDSIVDCVVIHYTAGPGTAAKWFSMPESRASSHFVINRDGKITQMVSLEKKAWHAGKSEWWHDREMTSNVNDFSIGIEIENHGMIFKNDNEYEWESGREMSRYKKTGEPIFAKLYYDNGTVIDGYWEPYYDPQIVALSELLSSLRDDGYGSAIDNICGHQDCSMPFSVRKKDPGPLFPWYRICEDVSSLRTSSSIVKPQTS